MAKVHQSNHQVAIVSIVVADEIDTRKEDVHIVQVPHRQIHQSIKKIVDQAVVVEVHLEEKAIKVQDPLKNIDHAVNHLVQEIGRQNWFFGLKNFKILLIFFLFR